MTTLSTSLVNPASGTAAFWISLQQETVTEFATTAEAAETIDRLFDIEPCSGEVGDSADEVEVEAETLQAAEEELWHILTEEERASLCADADGSYTAQVRVYRSHQDRPYHLLLQGGNLVRTTTGHIDHRRQIVAVQNSNSVTLDLPGDQAITASWQGPCWSKLGRLDVNPTIRISGSRINWDGNCSGTLLVTCNLPYDLAEIRTEGEECTVTGLYHLVVDEISLQAPPVDEQARQLCGEISEHWRTTEDGGDCFREVEYRRLCTCSGDDAGGGYTVQEETSCPDGASPGSVVERLNRVSYVDCGEVDQVNKPAYYQKYCCEPPPWPLPRCKESYSPFNGRGLSQTDAAELQARFGDRLNLVGIGPRVEPCGRLVVKQDINPANCCDDIIPLEVDPTQTSANISPGGVCVVAVQYGAPVKTWRCNSGYRFDNSLQIKKAETSVEKVFASADGVCGDLIVTVDDGCSRVLVRVPTTATAVDLFFPYTQDLVIAPETRISIECVGGIPPFSWSAGQLNFLEAVTSGRVNIVIAPASFCGSDMIVVTDACGHIAQQVCLSSAGHWETLPLGSGCVADFSTASGTLIPASLPEIQGQVDGKYYRSGITYSTVPPPDGTVGGCPLGNDLGSVTRLCQAFTYLIPNPVYSGGVCSNASNPNQRVFMAEQLQSVTRWVC